MMDAMEHVLLDGLFDGQTYEPDRDGERLFRQARLVWRVMRDGQWRTLYEIAARVGAPSQSVSARLRDLRKKRFGAHTVERRHIGQGIFEYRLVVS